MIEKIIHICPTKSILYKDRNDKIWKSKIKEEHTHGYTNEDDEDVSGLPNKYYWKTPDGWLYLYDKDKPDIISLNVLEPLPIHNVIHRSFQQNHVVIYCYSQIRVVKKQTT